MTIPLSVPTLALAGVPVRSPVAELNVAHDGKFVIEKINASPSESDAEGWKLYFDPAATEVMGCPEIVGGEFVGAGIGPPVGAALTVIANGLSDAVKRPSLTVIVIGALVPTSASAGTPVSRPDVVSNTAHTGGF